MTTTSHRASKKALPSNKTLNSISSTRNSEAISNGKKQLKTLLDERQKNFWAIGDLLIELTSLGCVVAHLTEEMGYKDGSLSEFLNTATAFPKETRKRGVPFFSYLKAHRASQKVAREVRKHIENNNPSAKVIKAIEGDATPNPLAALDLILAKEKAEGRRVDSRKATNLCAAVVHEKIKAVTASPKPIQDDSILNRCLQVNCNDFLRSLAQNKPSWTPKLVNFDPPYGSYEKLKDGRLAVDSSAAAMLGGSNLSTEDAIKTTVDSILLSAPLFGVGTTGLLWQNSKGLRLPIVQAIADAGLEVEIAVIWDKEIPQPGDFVDAYTPRTEICYVLKKAGATVLAHEQLKPRGNVLRASWEDENGNRPFWFSQSAGTIEPTHIWKKPISMMEWFVRKHTYAGDVVLDLYGCTGSCAIAAANLGRSFVYCESFEENFQTFTPKVLEALEKSQKKALVETLAGTKAA